MLQSMKSSGDNLWIFLRQMGSYEIFFVGSILVAGAKVHTHHLESSFANPMLKIRSNRYQNKETSLGFAFFCKEDREGGTL